MTALKKTLGIGVLMGATLALGVSIGQASADQPRMHSALDHLRAAREDLQAADRDKGGHRGAALRMVNNAIAEVERGIAFDRRH